MVSQRERDMWEKIAAADDGRSPVPPGGLCPACSLPGKPDVISRVVTCKDSNCGNTWNMGEGKGLGNANP